MGYGAIAGQDFWLVKNRYNQNDYKLNGYDFVLGNAYSKACKIRTSVDVKKQKTKADCYTSSHITLQPKTGFPLILSRFEPGQYLNGRPPGKTRLVLEEVLVRPAGSLTLWSV